MTALVLPAHLDLAAAAPLKAALLARRGGDLTLDGSSVSRLGALCLQVLLAAAATWRSDGRAFEVSSPSPGLEEGLLRMGARDMLLGGQGA